MTSSTTPVVPPRADPDGGPALPGADHPARRSRAARPTRLPRLAAVARFARTGRQHVPAWGQALLLFVASRVLFTFVAVRAADMAAPHPGGRPWTYLEIANNWDGTWYRRIAVEGYPSVLPVDAAGAVAPNTWAFYPLFPRLVQGLTALTGLEWTAAATVVSLTCAAGAVVLLRSVLAHVAGPRTAMWAVAFLCFFPAAPVLQLPYSESLALLLLAATFRCLQRGRYLVLVPVLLLLGLARPVAVPVAAVLGLHLLRGMPEVRGMPIAEAGRALAGPAVACAAAAVAAVEWPLLAWRGTGVRDAYTLTMASWRTPHEVVPVRPWIGAAQYYLGDVVGPVLLVAGLVALAWWIARRGPGVIGADLTAWCACYSVYLLAVLDSFTSLPRYLLPLAPLGAVLAATSSARAFRAAVTVAFGAGGVVWMLVIWRSSLWAP